MTKAELISEVARKTGLPRKDVGLVINAVLEALKEAFFRKERVELRGFGVFMTKTRKPRVGRNPRTKEEVRIPSRTVVVFKPSKVIKENL
ncbi:MAG: hypothetical protein DRQ10_06015 [Candidatus Hydrothermota bacterium]|nr:MAG: hypothetical protein DRQ10_06015 [Candidatus Hydrothermae bacterium]